MQEAGSTFPKIKSSLKETERERGGRAREGAVQLYETAKTQEAEEKTNDKLKNPRKR